MPHSHDPWTVTLSPGECIIAATIAANRQVANREANVVNLQGGSQPNMTTEMVGIFGELAVARMLNCYPDLSTALRRGSSDLHIGRLTLDVKTTRFTTADLRIDERASKSSDLYVLAIADWTEIRAVGYAIRSLDCIPENLNRGNSRWSGAGWVIPQGKLRKMGTLKDALEKLRLPRDQ